MGMSIEGEPKAPLHPDQLVNEIFRLQNEIDAEGDPGDMLIEIQDDSALVMVVQFGKDGYWAGTTIQGVLEGILESLKARLTSALEPAAEPKEGLVIDPESGRTEVWEDDTIIGYQG